MHSWLGISGSKAFADERVEQEMVVLLHGLGRGNSAMWLMARRLEDAGYLVERVGYSSLDQSPEEIVEHISTKIDACCIASGHILHFVGHSLGGLLIRAYLQENRLSTLGRVVLVGTPNQGTEIVDRLRDKRLMQLLGPTASALGTDDGSFPQKLDEPYYPVGVFCCRVATTAWSRSSPPSWRV